MSGPDVCRSPKGVIVSTEAPDRVRAGRDALADIDKVLAQKPDKDDATLSKATQQLCLFRDRLIEAQRRPDHGHEDSRRLTRVNAIISIVLAVHFPLGDVPWDELEKARSWLADLTV